LSVSDTRLPPVTRFVQDPSTYAWTFGGNAPVRVVRPGEILDLFVEDCYGGRVRSTADLPSRTVQRPFVNPQTGPFFVEGAEPGDTLAIHLVEVEPARDWAVSTQSPLVGSLTGTKYTAGLQDPLPERVWVYSIDAVARTVTFEALDSQHRVVLPLEPFHGTIGVAPAAFEVRSALVPEAFGGNMDTPEACAGHTIFLGVNVPGALFSLGDGHCRMGEGELCGSAVESAMNTLLVVDVIKGVACPWPRIESDDSIMVAGSYRPLEDGFRIAHAELVRWVTADTGLSVSDAHQLVSQIATSRIANVVDPNYTIVAKAPKRYLPRDVPWMAGTHDRLRAVGRAFLANRGTERARG
jgi:acetamidase/formamidase